MAITHHPGAESLMSCSAGSMPEAFAAVMASHIAMCPACCKELALMQEIGTALFDAIEPATVARPAPVLAMRGEEAELGSSPAATAAAAGDVPAPLASTIGHDLDCLQWRRVARGVWQHQIPLSHPSRGALRLIKVAPGLNLPEHGHEGSEMTLVLRGSFSDNGARYNVGDVADLGQDVEHAPISDPQVGCICLIASDGKMRFRSRLARLIQPLTGF